MDIFEAYQILGVTNKDGITNIEDNYVKKRAEIISQNNTDEVVEELLQRLEIAKTMVLDTIAKNNDLNYGEIQQNAPTSPNALVIGTSNDLSQNILNPKYYQCPICGEKNPANQLICDKCNSQLSRPCPYCGKSLRVIDKVCTQCGTPTKEYDIKVFNKALETEQRSRAEVDLTNHYKDQNSRLNRRVMFAGLTSWVIIFLLLTFLCLIIWLIFDNLVTKSIF